MTISYSADDVGTMDYSAASSPPHFNVRFPTFDILI